MFTQEELASAMQGLDTPEQISILESLISDFGITNETADLLSMFMMGVLLDLDGGTYPVELVKRATAIATGIRDFNETRFNGEKKA